MKKILLICVTYHSDNELHAFVESARRAAERVQGRMQVDIEIADSGQNNKGYLGGAAAIYNNRAQGYDFVSISNVDLVLEPDFFEQLMEMETEGTGWLAPDIYTNKINRHENPYMLTRPSKRNFIIWHIIYSCTWIYRMYHRLYVLKSQRSQNYPACEIYAGHGSFMLFTKAFVEHNPEIHFPGFMYGEEIYMAELNRAAGLTVRYVPTLHIANTGNINTGLIHQAQKSQWSKESLRTVYKQFFSNGTR